MYYVLLTALVAALILALGAGFAFACRMPEVDRDS